MPRPFGPEYGRAHRTRDPSVRRGRVDERHRQRAPWGPGPRGNRRGRGTAGRRSRPPRARVVLAARRAVLLNRAEARPEPRAAPEPPERDARREGAPPLVRARDPAGAERRRVPHTQGWRGAVP